MRTLLIVLVLVLVPAANIHAQGVEHGPAGERTPTPEPTLSPDVMPTRDRLAAPPTVPSPDQADAGAQLYWLHCQPCHGDMGQGLTDEWRAQYPPEDQYCWNSGCHGDQAYSPDFRLPMSVPAVIGDKALSKFQTLDGVYRYVRVAMPYFYPGSLTEDEYLAILAHLARGNGLWDNVPLSVDRLTNYAIPWYGQAPAATATALAATMAAPEQPVSAVEASVVEPAEEAGPHIAPRIGTVELALAGVVGLLVMVGGVLLWRTRNR